MRDIGNEGFVGCFVVLTVSKSIKWDGAELGDLRQIVNGPAELKYSCSKMQEQHKQ